ncbi:uncharacterized protein LOC117228670 isoform X2 [Megalopta genalis]|uniref:uncharacterized protein LOC117228670 isoform X2 n=1 Tax=Megalopta genalis TaxID=115081 RepID=UPI003FD4E1A1
MGFVLLSLSLLCLLNNNAALCDECERAADEAAAESASESAAPITGIVPRVEGQTVEGQTVRRELCSDVSSDASTANPVVDDDETFASSRRAMRTAEVEAISREPLIIDLGNIPYGRLRRSDSNELTDSAAAEQEDEPEPSEDDDSSEDSTADRGSEEDPATNVREERNLDSDEMLDGVEQDRGRTLDGWYRRRSPFTERRSPN